MSNRVESEAAIRIYEVAGTETASAEPPIRLTVRTHWNERDKIVLTAGGGQRVTVVARDLLNAVESVIRANL